MRVWGCGPTPWVPRGDRHSPEAETHPAAGCIPETHIQSDLVIPCFFNPYPSQSEQTSREPPLSFSNDNDSVIRMGHFMRWVHGCYHGGYTVFVFRCQSPSGLWRVARGVWHAMLKIDFDKIKIGIEMGAQSLAWCFLVMQSGSG